LRARERRVEHPLDVLRGGALGRAGRVVLLPTERRQRIADLLGRDRHELELARRQLAVVADRRVAAELADLLRVLGRDLTDQLAEHPADELASVLERR